ALGACEAGPGFRTTSVEITPATVLLDAIGLDTLLVARVVDDRGRDLLGAGVSWTSTDPLIASIDGSGRLTALAPGSTTVRATASGLGFIEASGTAQVEVAPVVTSLRAVAGEGQSGTVDLPLAIPLQVKATDRRGEPVVGQQVDFMPHPGGGRALPVTSSTDAEGVATSEWTLGPTAGTLHRLSAGVPGSEVTPVEFEALALAGPPAIIEVVSGGDQVGIRGRPLPQPIDTRVTDALGNATAGVDLTFTPAGGGTVTEADATTDLTGAASASWTLGDESGGQQLRVDAGAASTLVHAVATEVPAALLAGSATTLAGTVAMPVPDPPSVIVRDGAGRPVPGVAVSFEVTAGGGTIELGSAAQGTEAPPVAEAAPVAKAARVAEAPPVAEATPGGRTTAAPAVVHTDVDGRATIGAWVLGEVAGEANQALRASILDAGPLVFTATARAGPPALLSVLAGDDQTGPVTMELPQAISVRVVDAFSNPVPGAEVGFSPSSGYTTPGIAATDAAGVAVTRWTLGPDAGAHTLEVTAAGSVAPVQMRGTATGSATTCALNGPSPGYDLKICWVGVEDPTVASALDEAATRWQALIVGDLPDVVPNAEHPTCVTGAPWVSGPELDDLVLYVTVETIDGAGGALAGAAPCFVRDGSGLPTFARLRVDRDDVATLAADGQLVALLVHEIGHALGFGTVWTAAGLLAEPASGATGPPPDTHFTGARAIQAFDASGGSGRTVGAKVPVQNRGGGGVQDVHWRESVFGPELMTSELDSGVQNPLSRITVEAMGDIGYVVAADQSDAYVVPFPNFPVAGPGHAAMGSTPLGEDVWWGPIGVVDAAGTLVRIRRFQHRR
ncbi:MAG: hypothetical protein HKN71_01990, partial [Gemmatimonadetes bacterium]|nr:hypothetical protein [Gemmatimonadota bacterium]